MKFIERICYFLPALMAVATAAQAVQFQDLQVKGGGYADWTPYAEGMPLQAGSVELKGMIVLAGNENYGAYPGSGFFSASDADCVADTRINVIPELGYTPPEQVLSLPGLSGCFPTFSSVGYRQGWNSYYTEQFSLAFETTMTLASPPTAIHYKINKIDGIDKWIGEVTIQWANTFKTNATLTFNGTPPVASMFATLEDDFPTLFPSANSTDYSNLSYNGFTWTARAYTSGWIVGTNEHGTVWYYTPETDLQYFAADVASALTAIGKIPR